MLVPSAGLTPKLKAGVVAFSAFSSALGRPKLNPVGTGPAAGETVPEAGADFLPKKSGTDEVPSAEGGAEGLPRPKLTAFLGPSVRISLVILENSGGGLAGVEDAVLPREKKPVASGLAAGTAGVAEAPVSGGDAGSATMDPEARGEEARGRLELSRESGPAPGRLDGTVKLDFGV